MSEFRPYIIQHLQIGEIRNKMLSGGRYYLVIWQGELPLGHYWLESEGDVIALAVYEREILERVGPVMEYYQQNPSPGGSSSSLSVVICTRNRPEELERSIR